MANPLSVGALTTFPFGPGQLTDNVSGLGNNQAKSLGVVGTTLVQYYDDLIAPIQLTSAAAGVSATGFVSFYIVCGETPNIGGGPWTNGFDPNVSVDQSSKLVGLTPISPSLAMTTNNTTCVFSEFSIYSILGFMPSYWAVVIYNQSGANLPGFVASPLNHIARHALVSYA